MNNFSGPDLNMVDYCDDNNGGRDPGTTGHGAMYNNWGQLDAAFPGVPHPSAFTPDAFYSTAPQSSNDLPFSYPTNVNIIVH